MYRDTIKFKNLRTRKIFLNKWFVSAVNNSNFKIEDIDLKNSKDWFIKDGIIRHRSGKFFQVVGLEWVDNNGRFKRQPFLNQQEVGVLGFLMRQKKEMPELLVQAKIEPGNVKMVQIAPTCQATESNALRVHGGSLPPYITYFTPRNREIVYDKKQSEQGTRFYKKLNRNALIITQNKIPLIPSHKWIEVSDLLSLLHLDYLVNTDARSVLACSPWWLLVGHSPFVLNKKGFGAELAKSYQAENSFSNLDEIKLYLKELKIKIKEPKIIKLSKLPDWRLDKKGIFPINKKSFLIKQIKVRISSREITNWDQPIIESTSEGRVVLLCGRHKDILYFLFKASIEPGLYNKVELTPALIIEPGEEKGINKKLLEGIIKVDCHQSEEGGRFFKDRNHFQIIDRGEIFKPEPNFFWLTLRQIRQLLD